MSRCKMLIVMQTVGIDPMRTRTSQFDGPLIHPINEGLVSPAHLDPHILRHCVGDFICRSKQDRMQRVIEAELLTHKHSDTGIPRLQKADAVLRERHRIVGFPRLQRYQRSQKLRDAGRKMLFLRRLCVENRTALHIHYNGRRRMDLRPFRPSGQIIGVRYDLINRVFSGFFLRSQLLGRLFRLGCFRAFRRGSLLPFLCTTL